MQVSGILGLRISTIWIDDRSESSSERCRLLFVDLVPLQKDSVWSLICRSIRKCVPAGEHKGFYLYIEDSLGKLYKNGLKDAFLDSDLDNTRSNMLHKTNKFFNGSSFISRSIRVLLDSERGFSRDAY